MPHFHLQYGGETRQIEQALDVVAGRADPEPGPMPPRGKSQPGQRVDDSEVAQSVHVADDLPASGPVLLGLVQQKDDVAGAQRPPHLYARGLHTR